MPMRRAKMIYKVTLKVEPDLGRLIISIKTITKTATNMAII